VDILASDGTWLARGGFSPVSQILVRAWTFTPDEPVDGALFDLRLGHAAALRASDASIPPRACRLVHAESDGLPGLVVDRYGDFLVCQFLTAGIERWRHEIVKLLAARFPCRGIYERSDADVRTKEGLPSRCGTLHGEDPPAQIVIEEDACRFSVDVRTGHKTGFYLDQRDNRRRVGGHAKDAAVLNAFSYTGAFGIHALLGGATSVTQVDTSAEALAAAGNHAALNGIAPERCELLEGDVFQVLRRFCDCRRRFDVIVLDPPKFAASKAQLPGACRGYKDINRLAFKLLNPGGRLFTFSCSGLMTPELFQKIVADAALDAGRGAAIVHWLTQAPDHPVALNFPEGAYLKGLDVRVD
jgi:23S rRNA (cytosine1962-C5)-methyltransferase